jgi:hypothetical protein
VTRGETCCAATTVLWSTTHNASAIAWTLSPRGSGTVRTAHMPRSMPRPLPIDILQIGDLTTRLALRQTKLLQQLCRVRNSSPTEASFFRALDPSSSDEVYGLPSLLDDSLVVCRIAGRFVVKRLPRQSSGSQQEISRSPLRHISSPHPF